MAVAKKKDIKKRTQTEAQKKKVEDYKSKQAAMDKAKKPFGQDYYDKPTARKYFMEGFTGARKGPKGSIQSKGTSAAKQEKAAIARNEAKRKPIMTTAKAYQKSRSTKKK